jgi:hypothetical protein
MIAASRFKYGRGVDQVRFSERHLKDPNLSKMIYRVEVERNLVLRRWSTMAGLRKKKPESQSWLNSS